MFFRHIFALHLLLLSIFAPPISSSPVPPPKIVLKGKAAK
jgi:hypothetical protein